MAKRKRDCVKEIMAEKITFIILAAAYGLFTWLAN